MARKRMISPDIHTDAKYIQLNHIGRLLFTGMMNFADDEGIFEDNPIEWKCKVFPADDITLGLLEDYMSATVKLKLIEKGENKLLKYKNWHEYQKINHPTPSKYIFIPITNEEREDSGRTTVGLSEDSGRTPSQFSIDKNRVVKNSINKSSIEVKENSSKKTKTQLLKEEFTFDRFYSLYPRKIKKDNASKAFNRIPAKYLKDLFDGLNAYIRYWKDGEVGEEFIPHASSWLNAKQWNDTVPEVKKEIKFKDEQDKEIYNRNQNLAEQSKRFTDYMKEAKDKAIDEVPDLIGMFKKGKDNSETYKDTKETNTPPKNNPPL